MRKVGKVIFFISLILMLLCGIGGGIAAGTSISKLATVAGSLQSTDGEGARIELKAGDTRTLLSRSPSTTCTVTDPDGNDVDTRRMTTGTVSTNDTTLYAVAEFTAPRDGTYTITCDNGAEVAMTDGSIAGTIIAMSLGIIAIVAAVFLLGGVILGLVLWLVGANREKSQAQHSAAGPYQQGPPR